MFVSSQFVNNTACFNGIETIHSFHVKFLLALVIASIVQPVANDWQREYGSGLEIKKHAEHCQVTASIILITSIIEAVTP